jgi:transposase
MMNDACRVYKLILAVVQGAEQSPYWKLDGTIHALCNAHLLRELLYVSETTNQGWAQRMSDFLLDAHQLREAVKVRGKVFSSDEVQAFRVVFDDIVREGEADNPTLARDDGRRGKQSTAANLLRRFRLHADAVLRFIGDFDVPFTNNEAERAVRMPKVKQKISGCFRSLEGAQHFCVIRSVLDTLRKQGHSMFTVLQRAFLGNPIPSAA